MPTDYFTFFGLPRKLNVDEAKLQRDFYGLSRKLHPDVYAQSSGREQDWSLETTSLLNDAFRTLKDPVARTEYLLKLEGMNTEEQSKSATDAARASGEQKKQIVPPDLLEEVFELNMQLEEGRGRREPAARSSAHEEDFGRQVPGIAGRAEAALGCVGRAGYARPHRRDRSEDGAGKHGGRSQPEKLHQESGSGCE